ncbi:hypothetical protein NMK54_11695 [Nocardia otitidiscaviarum]|uniref:hypothetical protein n=1 Tax=Nocardia otitidiscaviarum TaxID=1823 RepID=UPI0020CBCCB1|nr:hypothetical protein [Nocardia otitidiscaviarum]MCP9620815.1 hypothetical protein [Nocardia otitidiscaviarum]
MHTDYAPAVALLIGILVFTTLVVVTLRWRGRSWLVLVLGGVAAAVIGYAVGLEAIFLMW